MRTLTLRTEPPLPLEAPQLAPERLQGQSHAEIAAIPLLLGNRTVPLGEWFTITGDPASDHLVIVGNCARIKRIGEGMTRGTLTLEGDAGMHLGAMLAGGTIEVRGHVGDWAGAEMRGGHLHIRGNAGNNAAGAYRGSRKGMRGGVMLIDGNAGHEVGAIMRRGILAIGGSVGDFAGCDMIAGTLVGYGAFGSRCGAGVKRGTILALGESPERISTFPFDCLGEPVYPVLLQLHLRQLGFPAAQREPFRRFARFSGDRLLFGKGELLIATQSAS
ncbi:formylmethanofuran dehydrogenase subunit C [Tuwongella immobilis]|uniref:Uncharacterized protein n=1 Tax=Tuwongella immobilis TaxID=692036 RepID=A0A6C2YIC0_9BACT|nr:formylmethanofuran dehydrogenase subunit C [Tuwongella immobilis]VIP01114.1 formylmethanofuran dehydrogenase subunit c : Formyltransferase/hydrolase complex subunit C OS=uncultured bacterium BAC10-4 GN=fhcC PE=4 SV=1: GXGXG [Tuwongella immobilis]VTR97653.1 formylmethanofuran dehydrogenase subunit c : Formyltransferase/hydrolase complex subunit C OS=uncultured bacterium BAC10-4 GN=fhcC PE=4 SV=1: GXGXG [Tuwongella immobilis]